MNAGDSCRLSLTSNDQMERHVFHDRLERPRVPSLTTLAKPQIYQDRVCNPSGSIEAARPENTTRFLHSTGEGTYGDLLPSEGSLFHPSPHLWTTNCNDCCGKEAKNVVQTREQWKDPRKLSSATGGLGGRWSDPIGLCQGATDLGVARNPDRRSIRSGTADTERLARKQREHGILLYWPQSVDQRPVKYDLHIPEYTRSSIP
jgi:hypothetical protein